MVYTVCMALPRSSRALWILAGALWGAALVSGFTILWHYAAQPGERAPAPARWPAASSLTRDPTHATLVMFVHPRCPCSHASLVELGHLVARVRGRVAAHVAVVRPTGVDDADFAHGELRSLAASLPEVRLVDDVGGVEARRFGAETSGATLVYETDGALAFSGGLTSVRGHEGDSFGQERIVALLSGQRPDRADSPVFGCPLDDHSPPPDEQQAHSPPTHAPEAQARQTHSPLRGGTR